MAQEEYSHGKGGIDFKALFESMPGNSALLDVNAPDFTITAVTKGFLDNSGASKEQLIGKGIFESFPSNTNDDTDTGEANLRASFAHVLKHKQEHSLEAQRYDVLNKEGVFEERYWRTSNRPFLDAEGNVLLIIHSAEEVTASVKGGEAQAKVDEMTQMNNVFMQAPLAIHILKGPELIIEMANDRSLEIWGRTKDIIGKPINEVLPELLKQGYKDAINKVRETGKPVYAYERPVVIQKKDLDEPGFYNFVIQPYFEGGGSSASGVLIFVNDVTEKVRSQNELAASNILIKESEERFRTMAEGTEILIAVSDETSKAIYFNNAWFAFTGRSTDDLLNFGWADLIHEDDRKAFVDHYLKCVELHTPFTGEFRMLNHAGEYRWLYAKGPVRFRPDGSFAGFISSAVDITERKAIENALQESEQQVRSIVESAPFPIGVYTGREMRIILANQSIMDVWGKGNDIIGKLYSEVLPELENQAVYEQLDKVFTTGISLHAKNRRIDLFTGGKLNTYYFNYSFTPLYNAAGEVYGVMNTAADVSDLNIAMRTAEESEHRYRMLIEESPVATAFYTGRELKLQYANDIMMGYWGKGNVIGQELAVFLPELHGQPFLGLLEDVYTTGVAYSGNEEKVSLFVDGELKDFYYTFTYKALRNTAGEIYGIHHVAIDVTSEVLARRALEESNDQLQFAIEATELGTFDYNPLSGKFSANDRLKEWFGLKPENEIDLTDAINVMAEKDRDRVTKAIQDTLNIESGGRYDIEYLIQNPITGRDIFVRAKGRAWFNEDYVAYRFNGTLQDVTQQALAMQKVEELVAERTAELAEANKNLQRSNAELAQFAYIASHDLQEPLRKISTYSQMLESSLGNNLSDKSKNYFSKMHASSSRMLSLIRDVLAYSQLSTTHNLLEKVDLNRVVENVRMDFELLIEQKRAAINTHNLPELEAIPLQMSQLFTNLISNALKFIKPGVDPVINITAAGMTKAEVRAFPALDPDAAYYKITFADNGIGFEQEYAQQIFNIFQRLHLKTAYEGTGIGLALCKKIAQNHHGDIYAEGSMAAGASFNVILPQVQPAG